MIKISDLERMNTIKLLEKDNQSLLKMIGEYDSKLTSLPAERDDATKKLSKALTLTLAWLQFAQYAVEHTQ